METEVIEEEVTEEEVDTEIEGEDAEPVIEEWMKEDAEGQTSEDLSANVPTGKHVRLKKKLLGEISEKDQEIADLKAKLNDPAPKPNKLVKPNRDDYVDREAEYDLAKDKYDENRLGDIYTRKRIKERDEEGVKQFFERIENDYDAHLDRTISLVEKHGISEDKIDIAHTNVKNALAEALPKMGKNGIKHLASMIGKGSETVIYSLGVNKVKRDKLIELAKEDPNGLKLAVFLGEQKQLLNNPKKPRSNAPDPVTILKGDETVSTRTVTKLKKEYDKIGAGTTESYNIKKKAKALGADVSKW